MRKVMTLVSAILTSVFSGGMLISMVLALLKVVVSMKKVSSRKATSTMGVMSIWKPRRFLLRFACRPLPSPFGESTRPMSAYLLFEHGYEVEGKNIGGFEPFEDMVDGLKVGVYIGFDYGTDIRVCKPGCGDEGIKLVFS